MKKLSLLFLAILLGGCGSMGMGMRSDSSGASSGASSTQGTSGSDPMRRFPGMPASFEPYYYGA